MDYIERQNSDTPFFLYYAHNFPHIPQTKGPWLFDLRKDQQESYDVSTRYPDEMKRLQDAYQKRVAEMQENPRGWLD
ncbi:MAG: hypothetical protein OXC05_01715 [Halieaceae bacterium]|nr:hypothetical protein [Halieaceae bacterium]